MLYHNRVSVSEGINANKTGNDLSKLCDICYFYFFKNKTFNYEPYICNGCHGTSQKATNLNEIKVFYIKNSNYRVVSNLSCKESIWLLERSDLTEKFGYL